MALLTTAEIALGRHHTYTLLSQLYLDGLSPGLLPYAQALPRLAEALPQTLDMVEAAARHYHLFGLNIFPYESVFLDPEGLLGGNLSNQVARRYQAAGYQPGSDVAPDHVGHELGFLAHLCAAEADAATNAERERAREHRQRQKTFTAKHLVRWLPPFLVALQRQADPFYQAVASLTWEVVGDHFQEEPGPWFLPPRPALLANEDTGLRQIASTLLATPLSGFFLGRDAIGQLARHQTLPRGFGDRQQMLLNLLRSAAQYEQFPALLADLQAVVAAWNRAYAELARTAPALATAVAVWQEQLRATDIMLARLVEEAHAFTGDD